MAEWCLAHPWMTFFIALALLQRRRLIVIRRGNSRDDD